MMGRREAGEPASVAAIVVVAMITSPIPSACRWKRRRPASNFTSASSSTRSSTSRTPRSPCTAGRASIAFRAHRVSSSLKRTIEAPPASAQTISTTAVSSTGTGGTRHWTGVREAGIIGPGSARPGSFVGGLRQARPGSVCAPRLCSASRHSFHRTEAARPGSFHGFPESEHDGEADQPENRGAAEGREHPALGELGARVAPRFEHGDAVDEVAEREQPSGRECEVERRARPAPGDEARHERAREEEDEADPFGVRVEEGETGLDAEHGAVADLGVVLRRAREAVRLRVLLHAGGGVALDVRAEPRHGRPAGLAERDHDDDDQDDRQGWTPQIQSLPGRSCATLAPAAGFVMTRRLWQGGRVRTGAAYVAALRDGRAVYLDGERVKDVTSHPAFAEPIRRIAATYERARAAEADPALTYADPARATRHSNMWLVPRSAEDLGARRRVHRFWAEPSYGLMGRTPDHVASVLTAFAAWRQFFDRGGARFGDNVVRFYERARDEDLYLTYAIVPPQVDRSQPAHRHPEPFLHPGVVRETDGGIVVRGAQAIATSATMAD